MVQQVGVPINIPLFKSVDIFQRNQMCIFCVIAQCDSVKKIARFLTLMTVGFHKHSQA